MDNHEKIFTNRAEMDKAERIHCDKCFEQVVFMLKDKDHEFSLGLATVIECIEFAIMNGDLPKLPRSWCADVESILEVVFSEDVSYYDYDTFKKRNKIE